MMTSKLSLLFLTLFVFLTNVLLLAQSEVQVLQTIEADNLQLRTSQTDDADNIYLSGYFTGTAYIGTDSVTNPNSDSKLFVCKLDAQGNLLWTLQDTTSNKQWIYGSELDSQGNLIVIGNGIAFDSTLTTNLSESFVAKISSQGNLLWTRNLLGRNWLKDVCIDANDNIYLTGALQQNLVIGQDTLFPHVNDLGREIFLIKFDASGSLEWKQRIGDKRNGYDEGHSLCVDDSNYVYLAGNFYGTCPFPGDTLHSTRENLFIAKYDSNGNFIQVVGSRRPADCYGWHLEYNSNQTFTLFGSITGTGVFFDTIINTTSFNNRTRYFANFDYNWNINWVHLPYKRFKVAYSVAPYKQLNSDPGTPYTYYVSEMDVSPTHVTNQHELKLYCIDGDGNLRYSKFLTKNVPSYTLASSVNINKQHESIVAFHSQDDIVVGDSSYSVPVNNRWRHYIVKAAKAGNTVQGKVFEDLDQNGVWNTYEKGIGGMRIYIETDNDYVVTDSSGAYTFYCNPGNYRLRLKKDTIIYYTFPANPYYYDIAFSVDSTDEVNKDFGFSRFPINMHAQNTSDQKSIKVFPNPTNSDFTVYTKGYNGLANIALFNNLGQLVYLRTFNSSEDIQCKVPGPAGFYTLHVQLEDRTIYTRKIIKN